MSSTGTRRTRFTQLVLAAVALTFCAIPAHSDGPKVATAKKEVLVQSDHSWDGTTYAPYPTGQPELTMLKIIIAPHTALPWHTHPVPNAGYVLSGDLTIHDKESGKSVTYHAGQAFPESVNRIHRGESGDTETVLLVTYAGLKGTPTSESVKGEMKEY
ncbi:MAG TPA: cupin domain-containing protein [Drouetiella sp.]